MKEMKREVLAQISKALEHQNKNRNDWIPLAELVAEAYDEGYDFSAVGIHKQQVNRLSSAYRFLKKWRPEIIKSKKINTSFRNISFLPAIYGSLNETTRDKEIEIYIDKTLRGEYSCTKLEGIKVSLNAKASGKTSPFENLPIESEAVTTEDQNDQFINRTFDFFRSFLNTMIRDHGYTKLRQKYARKCSELAVQLESIADAQYKEERDNQKEIKL